MCHIVVMAYKACPQNKTWIIKMTTSIEAFISRSQFQWLTKWIFFCHLTWSTIEHRSKRRHVGIWPHNPNGQAASKHKRRHWRKERQSSSCSKAILWFPSWPAERKNKFYLLMCKQLYLKDLLINIYFCSCLPKMAFFSNRTTVNLMVWKHSVFSISF